MNVGDDAGRLAGSHSEQEYAPHSASVVCERDCWIHFAFGGESELSTVVPGDIKAAHPADKAKQDSYTLDHFDLLAQERMAHWAILVAILTGAGVFLLYETLRETSNATNAAIATTEETRRIGEAQTRGYITPKGLRLLASDGDGKPIVEITFENCGSTPVYELRVAAMIEIGPKVGKKSPQRFPEQVDRLVVDPFSSATIAGNATQPVELKYGGWSRPDRASRVASSTTFLHYIAKIYYRDVFDYLWEQDLYYLIFRSDSGDLEARNFTLNAKPRQIQEYPQPKER